MEQPLSRVVVNELIDLGVVSGSRDAALNFFAARHDSYLRSLWSRGKDASVEAYLHCYVNLGDLHNNTVHALNAAKTPLERDELSEGAKSVKTLSNRVWAHLMGCIGSTKF